MNNNTEYNNTFIQSAISTITSHGLAEQVFVREPSVYYKKEYEKIKIGFIKKELIPQLIEANRNFLGVKYVYTSFQYLSQNITYYFDTKKIPGETFELKLSMDPVTKRIVFDTSQFLGYPEQAIIHINIFICNPMECVIIPSTIKIIEDESTLLRLNASNITFTGQSIDALDLSSILRINSAVNSTAISNDVFVEGSEIKPKQPIKSPPKYGTKTVAQKKEEL